MGCSTAPLATIDADLLVVPWFEDEAPTAVPGVDDATSGEVSRAIQAKEFAGRLFETFTTAMTDPSWRARRLLLIGLGKRATFSGDVLRKKPLATLRAE